MRLVAALTTTVVLSLAALAAAQEPAPAGASRVGSRYTFTWPTGPAAPAPRGGTSRGVPVVLESAPSPQWQALRESGLSAQERDRRAILAMAGSYRVNFDFIEVAAFSGDGTRAQPYQSWGTERIFVDRDEPRLISLVHVLEMYILDAAGKPMPAMVTKHWRQEWRYQPAQLVEYVGANRWTRRALKTDERRGRWSQVVYQVDESPRYGSLGRWEHGASFSSWISGDTARPLPRREWSVRKDYELLRGTNRHTVTPTGWLQEENNLKVASAADGNYVGREYGVARYERIAADSLPESGRYYTATRAYWNEVLAVWDELLAANRTVTLKANSDQSGAYAELFQQAQDHAEGKLPLADAKAQIRASLARQLK
jgi:hypothetical protein